MLKRDLEIGIKGKQILKVNRFWKIKKEIKVGIQGVKTAKAQLAFQILFDSI